MDALLRVLMLEDVLTDAMLIEHELGSLGRRAEIRQVQTREGFVAQLEDFAPHIVLADYSLPAFDGLTALQIVRARSLSLPFIFVSGAIGEERAIEALRSGATDYVLKDRLGRLVSAIERALREGDEHVRRVEAEEALRRAHSSLEHRVAERTAELAEANQALQRYAEDLRRANDTLQSQAEVLEVQTGELQSQNEELVRVTQQLEAARAHLEAVLQQLPAGVILADASGELMMCNQATERIWRKSLDSTDSMVAWFTSASSEHDGAAYPHVEWPLARSLTKGEVVVGEEIEIERGDSSRATLSVNSAPIRGHKGRIVGGVITFNDVTERKEMETALRRAHNELERRVQERTAELSKAYEALSQNEMLVRKVLETLPVGVWIADQDGRIVSVNPVGRRIWAGEHYVGIEQYGDFKGWWADSGQLIAPEDWALYRAIRHGETSTGEEIEIECFDGSRKVILNSAAPIFDADGQLVAAIVVNEDITDRVKVELELARYAERLEILHQLDRFALAAQSMEAIARVTVKRIRQLVPSEHAMVALYQPAEAATVVVAVDAARETELTEGLHLPVEELKDEHGEQDGLSRVFDDLLALDKRSALIEVLTREGLRAYVSLPLIVEGNIIGSLDLAAQKAAAFSADAVETLRQVADSLAVALNTARLYAQVRDDRAQLQNLSRRLVEVQEAERRTIAQELHDEAGQSLTSLMVGLGLLERDANCPEQMLGRIRELKGTAETVMEGLHQLAVNLRPASLDRVGLVPTLRQYAESFGRQHGIDVQFEVLGMDAQRLPLEVETALYRVVQEALTNVARHARAQHVGIVLERRDDRAIAIIEDDGVGFDPDEVSRRGRLGLFGMRERAEMLDGSFTVESSIGMGTTVFVEVPCGSTDFDRR